MILSATARPLAAQGNFSTSCGTSFAIASFSGEPGPGDLGICEDHGGDCPRAPLRRLAEDAFHGDSRLRRSFVREARFFADIADGIDVRHVRAALLIDQNVARARLPSRRHWQGQDQCCSGRRPIEISTRSKVSSGGTSLPSSVATIPAFVAAMLATFVLR